jgi:hypothetical protein
MQRSETFVEAATPELGPGAAPVPTGPEGLFVLEGSGAEAGSTAGGGVLITQLPGPMLEPPRTVHTAAALHDAANARLVSG